MKKEFKNFIRAAKKERLSENERTVLRSKILEFISFNPIRGKTPVIRERNYLSVFEVRYFVKAASLVLIFAVIAGGSGVSVAASSALPGDKLYSIKVNVNEEIETSLARSPEARVAINSKKVERRLVEAQELDKDNKLSPELQSIVEKKIEQHIDSLAQDIEDLRKEGNVELALETTSNLTPVLEAHKEILEETEEGSQSEHKNTDVLIARVEDSIKEVSDSENAIIAAVQDDSEEVVTMAMMKVSDPVEDQLVKQAQDDIETLSENVEKVVKSRIKTAKEKISIIKSDRELELSIINKVPEVTTPENTIPAETKEASSIPASPVAIVKELPVTDMTPATEIVIETPTKVVNPTIVKIEEENSFDIDKKINEAERIIREAEVKLENGRFKEALSLAQEVNRIASEIETFKKLKAQGLAQQALEIQKALKAQASEAQKN